MTIDPNTPLGNATQSLRTSTSANVESLARALNLKVGQTVTGSVIQASQVTPATRQTLLQAYLQQTSSASTTAPTANTVAGQGAQGNTGSAGDLPALLQSAKLQLVKVQVGQQQLLTYTDLGVRPQQHVQLLLKTANTLTLINHSGPSSLPANSQAQGNAATGVPGQGIQGQASPALKQALRTALPNQAPIQTLVQGRQLSDSLQATLLLNQLTQSLGSYSAQTLIPKTLQDALKTVASHLRNPTQLSDPNTLKQALQSSGVQLEARLKQLSGGDTGGRSAQPATTSLAQQDLKAALLQLLQRTQPATTSIGSEGKNATANTANTAGTTLLVLLKTLLQGTPQLPQVKQDLPREALLQQLQQLVQLALNKIQYQQLQNLGRRAASQDGAPGVNHWQLELPMRFGSEVQPLHLQINEQWVQSRDEHQPSRDTGAEEPRKQRKWFVRLSFELPEAGFFHAQLYIINDAVNASLWAENPATLKQAQAKLDSLHERLNKAGIDVQSLDCFPGKPNQQDNRLGYSLVDIKT